MKKQWIGVLDCNNFFVSCERLFRPDLLDQPVVVLSSNDGCVVARSQEIKDMGIAMGVPYFQIKDILKKACATTFSSNFPLYRDISRRVIKVMCDELELVEQYSVDEAFFAIDKNPEPVVLRLKTAVERQVGIPVSIGVAKSKTQAKFASTLAKQNGGIAVMDNQAWLDLAPTIPLSKIWGVGSKMNQKYQLHNLQTVADFLSVDRSLVSKIFGVVGVRLQEELAGNSIFSVTQTTQVHQSITSSRSFANTTTDKSVLADAVAYHVRQVSSDLRSQALTVRKMRVSVLPSRYGDFLLRGGTKEAVLSTATSDTIYLQQVAHQLLNELYECGVPYKKVGVYLSDLVPVAGVQQQLFSTGGQSKTDKLMQVIDKLNSGDKGEVLMVGSYLKSGLWRTKNDTLSPAYTTRWSDVVKVQAK